MDSRRWRPRNWGGGMGPLRLSQRNLPGIRRKNNFSEARLCIAGVGVSILSLLQFGNVMDDIQHTGIRQLGNNPPRGIFGLISFEQTRCNISIVGTCPCQPGMLPAWGWVAAQRAGICLRVRAPISTMRHWTTVLMAFCTSGDISAPWAKSPPSMA